MDVHATLVRVRDDIVGGYPQGAAVGLNDLIRWIGVSPSQVTEAKSAIGPHDPEYYCELAMRSDEPDTFALAVTCAALILRRQLELNPALEQFVRLLPK